LGQPLLTLLNNSDSYNQVELGLKNHGALLPFRIVFALEDF